MSGRTRGPSLSNSGRYRSVFTASEDHQLTRLVGEYGEDNWAKVAQRMHHRTSRQCRERWFTYLSPNINLGPWSDEEDVLLVQLFPEIGTFWSRYLLYFKNRTVNNIKNRWHTLSRRKDFHQRFPGIDPKLLQSQPRKRRSWQPPPEPVAGRTRARARAAQASPQPASPEPALPPEEVIFSIANLLNHPNDRVSF